MTKIVTKLTKNVTYLKVSTPTLVKNREIRRTCGTNILAHILLYIFIEELYQRLVKRIKEKLSKVKI